MNKKAANTFLIVSLAVSILSVAGAAFSLSIYAQDGKKRASANFQRLDALLGQVHRAEDLNEPSVRSSLAQFYRDSPSLLLISVYERGKGVMWRLPARSDYLPSAENTAAIPEPSYPPRSALLYSAPLRGDSSGRLAVDALYVNLSQGRVFAILRDLCLGLSAYLALACIVLFIASLRERGRGREEEKGDEGETTGEAETASGWPDLAEGPRDVPAFNSALDEEFTVPDLSDETFAPPPSASTDSPSPKETVVAPSALPETAEAALGGGLHQESGLFSPLSGLGWESYLADRLEAEISRSASFEQDLSFLLISFEGTAPEKPEYRATAAAIAEFFSFKDLAFERGPDGFAVILPNIDADHALRMADEFLKKLSTKLAATRDPLDYLPVFMGISSRSGRLVDSTRIGREAEAALKKAREEQDSHIVAFKPDPDKYRLYLASKGL
jgi:hypothetical protein